MKKTVILISVFSVYAAILIVAGIFALNGVNNLLDEYEASQPQYLIESVIKEITEAAEAGEDELSEIVDFDSAGFTSSLEVYGDQIGHFADLIVKEELTLAVKSSTLDKITYALLSGEDPLLYITIEGKSTVTRLAIFSITDWELESVVPVVREQEIIIPSYLSLSFDGKELIGEADGENNLKYSVKYLMKQPEYTVSDAFGNSTPYSGDALPESAWWNVTVPSNFKITVGSTAVTEEHIVSREDNPDYKYAKDYGTFPDIVTYGFYTLFAEIKPRVTDNLGEEISLDFDGNSVRVTDQTATDEIPSGVMSREEILAAAQLWSLFMTDDVEGAYHGFYTVAELLIPDSYLYNMAYAWATGIDITFTSPHTLGPVPFLNESVGNYIVYSENCFSCDVSFDKHMILNSWQVVMDKMNSTFYFVRGEDGVWRIADILEIVG